MFVILAKLASLFLAFLLLYWLWGKIFQQLRKIPWLKQKQDNLQQLRRNINKLLSFLLAILSLGVIGINSWWLYQGKDLKQSTLELVQQIPSQFWLQLAANSFKILAVFILVGYVLQPLVSWLEKGRDRLKKLERFTGNQAPIDSLFSFLETHLRNSCWLFAIFISTSFVQLPEVVGRYFYLSLKIYLIIIAGLLLIKASNAILDSLDSLKEKYASKWNGWRFYHRLKHLIPFLKGCLEYIIYFGIATLAVDQIESFAQLVPLGKTTVKIIAIIIITGLSIAIGTLVVEEIILNQENLTEVQKRKRLTTIPLIQSSLKYLIYFGSGIWILDVFGIDPAPILAAAGILGLAISLGAQNLVNDMVSGFFILFENYYLVGDFIEMEDAMGVVEAIELRTTRIRHPNGQVHIIRNGEIAKIVNYSKEYIYAVVNVGVDYNSDLDLVYTVLKNIGQQLKENYPQEVLEATKVDGIEEFEDSSILIRTLTKLNPHNSRRGVHNYIQRILRKMIKEAFDREGIQIPFPQRVVTLPQGDSLDK